VSDHSGGPEFNEDFWRVVHQRAERVRELVLGEIEAAEHLVFSEGEVVRVPAAATSEQNVVPVFTEPFWEDVETRVQRVRNLAAESLAAAEERLLDEVQAPAAAIAPVKKPASLRSLVRNFSLQRSDAFGFVAALLAAVLLVPQLIAPVMSSAGVQPPKILQFMIVGDNDKSDQQASEVQGEGGSTNGSADPGGEASRSKPVPSAQSPGQGTGVSGSDAVSGTGEGGTNGKAATGAAGSGQGGASNVDPAASPSPSVSPTPALPAPKAPTAPLEVHAVAVDSKSIRISWTDMSNDETGFQVDRQVPDGALASSERVGKDLSNYLWANLAPETRACFRVRAMNEVGSSDWAPVLAPGYVCATTPAVPAEPLPSPPPPQPEASPPSSGPAA